MKKEPTKQIIFNKPLERISADATELPYEISDNTKIKYQLNLIDHFSKYAFSYLIENKNANTIFNCIVDCFDNNGFPEELGTDHGLEFCNKKLKLYLNSKNIKFIHGCAFQPRSQGCAERLHRTLKINLVANKLIDGDNFNLLKANKNILFHYNNTIHSTTGFKPIEIFYYNSKELFQKVYENTLNSFKNLNVNKVKKKKIFIII